MRNLLSCYVYSQVSVLYYCTSYTEDKTFDQTITVASLPHGALFATNRTFVHYEAFPVYSQVLREVMQQWKLPSLCFLS